MLTSDIRTIFLVWATSVLLSSHLVSTQSFLDIEAGSGGETCTATSCTGNRECVADVCQCLTGYEGTDCTAVNCEAPTLENGSFLEDATDPYQYLKTVAFSCNAGFSLRDDPRAQCSATKTWVGLPTGTYPTCVADAVAGCASSPCQNGGVCADVDTTTGTFTCDCTASYSGDLCETATVLTVATVYDVAVRSAVTWDPTMADATSKLSIETCQQLLEQLGPELQNQLPNVFQALTDCALRQGSVIGEFKMTLDPGQNLANAEVFNKVQTAIEVIKTRNNGSNPLLDFDETYTTVNNVTPTATSYGLLAAYISSGLLAFIIIILIILILIYKYRSQKRRKSRSQSSYSEEDYEMDSMSQPYRGFAYPYRGHYWRPQPRDLQYDANTYYPVPQTAVAALPGPSWASDRESVYNWAEVRGGGRVNIFGGNTFGKRQEYF